MAASAATAVMLSPLRSAWAAWPKAAFDAQRTTDVVAAPFGGRRPEASDAVQIRTPEIAENGTIVPITVTATMPDVNGITIIAAAWVPGTDMMPRSMLMQDPCHSEEEPCSKIPAPAIQRVTLTPPVNGARERGKKIATNVRWGNCIACHSLPDGVAGGNVGSDLTDYRSRASDLQETYQRIWDVRAYAPTAQCRSTGRTRCSTSRISAT
jgi:hypothetical protein